MTAEIRPPVELASLIDAQGHRVTATVTNSGLLALLAHAPGGKLCAGGHPCLNAENARELGLALLAFADGRET